MSDVSRSNRLGNTIAALAAVLFSAKAILAKLIYQYDVDPITLMALRMGLSAPIFLLIAVIETRRARRAGKVLIKGDLWRIVGLGFFGYYLSSLLDFTGLLYVPVALERLVLFLTPTLVLLISVLWLGKSWSSRQAIALAVSYAGLILVFLEQWSLQGSNIPWGSLLVFLAALSYAGYLAFSGELVARIGSLRLVSYVMLVSCALVLIHFVLVHDWRTLAHQPMPVWGLSLINALLCTVAPVVMTMIAVNRIGAPRTAHYSMIGPISLIFMGAWILGEPITALQLLGTAVVIAGVMVVSAKRR